MKNTGLTFVAVLLSISTTTRAQEQVTTPDSGAGDVYTLSLEDLLQIEVSSASKRSEKLEDAPSIMTVVSRKEIEAFGAMNLVDVLNRVTSLYMVGSASSLGGVLSMRGDVTQGTQHVLILMNGRPIIDHLLSSVYTPIFEAFPIAAIEKIEVIRGPGSVLYGTNAYDGVVNLITRSEGKDTGQLLVRTGSFGTVQADGFASIQLGDLQIAAGLLYHSDNGWNFTDTDAVGVTQTQSQYQRALGLTLTATDQNFTMNAFYGRAEDPFMSAYQSDWSLSGVNNTQRGMIDLGYKTKINSKWQSSLNMTDNVFDYYPGFELPPRHTLANDIMLEWSNQVVITDATNILFGFTATTETGFDQDGVEGRYFIAPYRADYYTAYGEVDTRPWGFLKLIGGIQTNLAQGYSLNVVPRAGLVANFNSALSAKVLYSQAYRAPTAYERSFDPDSVTIANPALVPESVGTLDAQISYSTSKFQVQGSVFHSVQSNIIEQTDGGGQFENEGVLTSDGVELEGKYLANDWTFSTGVTYQRNSDEEGAQNPTFMPNLMWKTGVAYQSPSGVKIGIFDSYIGSAQPVDVLGVANVNPGITPYHNLTVNLNLDLKRLFDLGGIPKVTLNVFANNLLNAGIYYPDFAVQAVNSIPGGPGRTIYFGLGVDF